MKIATLFLALCAFATTAVAQTTGVPGFNDYTIAGSGSGSTSCTAVNIAGGGPTTFQVSTAPGAPVVFLFTPNCPCSPCFFPLPATSSACPIPYTACVSSDGTATNQSLDLILSGTCSMLAVTVPADAFGNATISINLPAGWLIGTQAAAAHPCNASSSFPVLMTQSYTVTT